jgi:hypothetical protein
MELETFTTGSRVSPVIRITQDNNTTPFFTCRQNADTMFSIKSNGDLQWRNSWNINTTATTMNIRYNNSTWASFKSENADVQFNGSLYFGSLDRGESALYFNGAGNDTSSNDCYIMNRTRSTNDVSELLIQKGRNTNDQIRFRCSNFTFQTPTSNENAENRGDNNDRFTIDNASVNSFGNNHRVTSTNVNMMDSKFVMNNTSLQVFNSITASTNSANMMNGTLVVTPNTITTTGDVNIGSTSQLKTLTVHGTLMAATSDVIIGSSGQPKILSLCGKRIAIPSFYTGFFSGFNGATRDQLNTSGSDNGQWKVFQFQQGSENNGGNPVLNHDSIVYKPVNNNIVDESHSGNHCLRVTSEGFYRIDLDIALQGQTSSNQRLRWIFVKNLDFGNPRCVGYFDVDEISKHFHLCAAIELAIDDRVYIAYQNWDRPDGDTFYGNGADDWIWWNYASITMHSI